jgi:hypothetical protein
LTGGVLHWQHLRWSALGQCTSLAILPVFTTELRSLHMGIAFLTFSAFSQPLHALARWLQPAMHGGARDAARTRTCKAPLVAHANPAWPGASVPLDGLPPANTGNTAAPPCGGEPLRSATTPPTPTRTSGHAASRHAAPRRVVRVLRTAATGTDTGRLVISGRMADVCAELDRMADREALLLQH